MLDQLKLYIRVRYTLIYIKTFEEERLLSQIEKIARELGYSVKVFNFVRERDPQGFLEQIERDNGAYIYILQDFHKFLRDDGAGVLLTRYLRNLKSSLKNQKKNIIITAPVIKLPDDLKEDFIILESPLPEYKEIKQTIEDFLERNRIGQSLSELLKDRITLSCLGLTIDQVKKIFAKTLIRNNRLDEKCLDQIIAEKKLIIGRNQVLDFYDTKETISNIGGLDQLKNWLKIRSRAFSQEAKDYGLPTPKGLLMLGVQGTGKSLTAKAVSSLWRLPLLRLDVGRIFGSLVGESEGRIRQAINIAETISPCILWIDEVDKAFAGLQGAQGDSGTSARVFGTIITWMQEKTKPVFVVATANDISKIPMEFLRKGRFDEIFFVDIPNSRERLEIFKIHITKTGRDIHNYELPKLVDTSKGFTGAEIEQTIKDAMYLAFADDERDYTTEDILQAINETVPLSTMMENEITALRSWAEKHARKASYSAQYTISQKADVDLVY